MDNAKPFYKNLWFIGLVAIICLKAILPHPTQDDSLKYLVVENAEVGNTNLKVMHKESASGLIDYHLLYLGEYDKEIVSENLNEAKKQLCKGKCNLFIYSEEIPKELFTKYEYSDNDIIYLSDIMVALLDYTDKFQYYR